MGRTKYFLGLECRAMKPTMSHRPAIWECLLGTVYARNVEGKIKYFGYDYPAAFAFAGVLDAERRVAKTPGPYRLQGQTIPKGQTVVWAR